jgi:RNA polymerase sigma factor (sigma-70 family)
MPLFYDLLHYLQHKQTYTDSTLIVALKNKEAAAFEYLYQNYKGALFAVIHQIIPDKDDAGDVLQDAFTTIWKNIDKYDASKGRLFTWMFNVSRNCAINTTRSKNYKSQQKIDSIDNYVNYTGNSDKQGININTIGLRKQVQLLREEYRKVLELSYFTGLTHDEIAVTLNMPVGTVKTRIRNAIIELRKHFV